MPEEPNLSTLNCVNLFLAVILIACIIRIFLGIYQEHQDELNRLRKPWWDDNDIPPMPPMPMN